LGKPGADDQVIVNKRDGNHDAFLAGKFALTLAISAWLFKS
jgi:hypothetical protein